jgi:sensor domain CHASE-containing protein/anti-sigma regulatory factor (Ser/Thr protein kinase)
MHKMHSYIGIWWQGRKLVSKLALLAVAIFILMIPVLYYALNAMLLPTFAAIEQQAVDDQKARVAHALSEYQTGLQNAVRDYAVWDSAYNYVAHPNKPFEVETLTPLSYQNTNIDIMAILRLDGTVLWSNVVDLKSGEILEAESALFRDRVRDRAFLEPATKTDDTMTYVRTGRGVYLLGSSRIMRSDGKGAPNGVFVKGVLLQEKTLAEALQVRVSLDQSVPAVIAKELASNPGQSVSEISADQITTRVGIFGLDKNLLTTIKFSTRRDIMLAGIQSVRSTFLSGVLAIFVLMLAVAVGVRTICVRRLQSLEAHIRNDVSLTNSLPKDLLTGADEIASLAQGFSALARDLLAAEEELQQRSYLQGKADSAAGLLHNVRNALVPIRIMQEKWLREETLPYRANMEKAVTELDTGEPDGLRRTDLERYLLTAARKIALSAGTRIHELDETRSSVDQIAMILATFDFDTSDDTPEEVIDLHSLFIQEVKKSIGYQNSAIDVLLPEAMPLAHGNRIQLGQVISNILVNASESLLAANPAKKIIRIDCAVKSSDQTLIVSITDNGEGITDENLKKSFERGFSTRNHKAGGIGLHWSANVMRAMGGSLVLESAGSGLGATASLQLKLAHPVMEKQLSLKAA